MGKSRCSCTSHPKELLVVMCCGNGKSGLWSKVVLNVEPWL